MDEPGITGYFCDENIERLRRCEVLAEKKGTQVSQIALAWIFSRDLNVFAITSPGSLEHTIRSVKALDLSISNEESAWLNLETD